MVSDENMESPQVYKASKQHHYYVSHAQGSCKDMESSNQA